MKEHLVRHAVRVASVLAAVAPVAVSVLDSLSWEWAVSLSAVMLTAGEYAQRVENAKTLRAFLVSPEDVPCPKVEAPVVTAQDVADSLEER